jgi:hypothetical protein
MVLLQNYLIQYRKTTDKNKFFYCLTEFIYIYIKKLIFFFFLVRRKGGKIILLRGACVLNAPLVEGKLTDCNPTLEMSFLFCKIYNNFKA